MAERRRSSRRLHVCRVEGNVVYLAGRVTVRECPECHSLHSQYVIERSYFMYDHTVCRHCRRGLVKDFKILLYDDS